MFGGGFFYAPFTQSAQYGIPIVAPDVLGGFGPWSSYITNVTFKARWLVMDLTVGGASPTLHIQLGLGPPGGEIVWQPSLATGLGGVVNGFRFVLDAAGNGVRNLAFPITVDEGLQLSARGRVTPAVGIVTVNIAMWG